MAILLTLASKRPLDFKGDKIRIEESVPYQFENTPAALDRLCDAINEFILTLPIPREKILSVGVNISGRVNPFTGYSYSIFYFEENPLSQIMEEKLHVKTFIENDTRSMTFGEYMQGVVHGEKDILFVNVSWGLGLGIIINGEVYYGHSGFSGEFGHFSFFDNEVLCHCGKKGCLETGASGSALCRMLTERYKEGSNTILASKIDAGEQITLNDLIDAIHKEDMLTIEILEEIGVNLGKGIAGLINIFNPELVILGGPLSETGEYLLLPIKSAVKKYSLNMVSRDTQIKLSKLGNTAGVLGACLLSRSKLLGML